MKRLPLSILSLPLRALIPAVGLTTSMLVCGCSSEDPAKSSTDESDIYGGSSDDAADPNTAVVALKISRAAGQELCSGALIAPNVVLTARHCVSKVVSDTISCDADGNASVERHVSGDENPASIGVYTGAKPSLTAAPVARGKAIVRGSSAVLCNDDIALVVLDTKIEGIKPLAVRMEGGPEEGEKILSIGYGQNDKNVPLGTRLLKKGVPVLAVGKGISEHKTPLGSHEFEVGKSTCEGDSGGPAISESTGAVIGVVSRGGKCTDDFGHIYTAPGAFKELFDEAFSIAGGTATGEDGAPVAVSADFKKSSAAGNDDADVVTSGDDDAEPKNSDAKEPSTGSSSAACSTSPGVGSSEFGAFGTVGVLLGLTALMRRRR